MDLALQTVLLAVIIAQHGENMTGLEKKNQPPQTKHQEQPHFWSDYLLQTLRLSVVRSDFIL